jgi:hypothetical protein
MASERKPSVYSDRGSYGSVEELDEYGVWIKCEPQDMSLTDSDDLEDAGLSMPDFDESATDTGDLKGFDPSELGEIELPENNFNIESDDNLPNASTFAAEESFGANFDEFPITSGTADTVPIISEDDFEVPTVEAIETSSRIKESDFSNQLLQKIASELSSIRNELAEMKKEFAIVRASSPAGEVKDDDQHGGFFSEEEDETIALTGDELNNILNTADFTEESGTNETPDDTPADTAPSGGSSPNEGGEEAEDGGDELIQIDLDSLGIDLNPDVPAEAEAPIEDPLPNVGIIEDDDELEKLRTDGAIPLNPAPENISYLEESEIADFADDASINSSSFDYGEAAIDELELAAVGIEDDAAESVTDNTADDSIDIDSLDDLAIASDSVETEEPAMGETADDDLDNLADISIETQADNGHDIVLPIPEDGLDIDILTDDSLDISIPDDDFAALPAVDDGDVNLSAPENGLDIDMLTDDSLDISIPEDDFAMTPITDDDLPMTEDDFAALPAVDDGADSMPMPEDGLVIDALTDDSLDLSMPEDDFAVPPISDDDLSIPEDDFAAVPAADDGADSMLMPEDGLVIDALTDDSLDLSIPEDEFTVPPISDDDLSMTEDDFAIPAADDFAVPPISDDDLSMTEDDFAMPAADDFAVPQISDDDLSMTEDDFSMPAADDDLPMPEDDFSMPAEDSGLSTPKDSIENIIPEDFEAEIEESPVPFDDDLKDELAVQEMASLLGATAKSRPERRAKTPVIRDFPSEPAAASKKKSEKVDLDIPPTLKNELKTVLSYMDRLLDSLPEEKIAEFAKSEYFDSYKKLFKELGLV